MHVHGANLNLLVALDALLEERSVTRAAARLGLSQPAMSHALARCRELFDDALLVRGEHGLVPTPRATALVGPLRFGLAQLEKVLANEPAFDPKTSTRRFSVASVDYICLTGLRTLSARLENDAPGVCIELRPVIPNIREQLESGALDLVLAGVEVEGELGRTPGLRRTRVASEDFLCIVRRGHPRVHGKLDLETYLSLGHVTVDVQGGACDHHVDVALRALSRSRRIAARLANFIGAPLLVSTTNHVATVPRALAESAAEMLPLTLFPPPIALPPGEADLWWHERFDDEPGHKWFRTVLRDAFAPYLRSHGRAPKRSRRRSA